MSGGPARILYLVETAELGGAEENLLQVASRVRRDRYQPCARVVAEGALARALSEAGVEVALLARRRWSPRLNPALLAELARTIRRERIALVHAYLFAMGLHGSLAGRLAGVPVLVSVRNEHYDFATRRRRLAYRLMGRLGCRFSAVSASVAERLERACGVPAAQITHLPNGVDLARYSPRLGAARARAALGLAPEMFTIGTVARLEKVKGIAYLLAAVPDLERAAGPVQVAIAGNGGLRKALERQAAGLGGKSRVVFLGHRRDSEVVLEALDAFALPSLSEGMSNALLQAMAMGVPCVATAVGGNPEVLGGGAAGLLVPPADAGALARALASLIASPGRRAALGAAARAEVERSYSVERMVARNEALYAELLGLPANQALVGDDEKALVACREGTDQ